MTQKEFDRLRYEEKKKFIEKWNNSIIGVLENVITRASVAIQQDVDYDAKGSEGNINVFSVGNDSFEILDEDIAKHFHVNRIEFLPFDRLENYLIKEVTAHFKKKK